MGFSCTNNILSRWAPTFYSPATGCVATIVHTVGSPDWIWIPAIARQPHHAGVATSSGFTCQVLDKDLSNTYDASTHVKGRKMSQSECKESLRNYSCLHGDLPVTWDDQSAVSFAAFTSSAAVNGGWWAADVWAAAHNPSTDLDFHILASLQPWSHGHNTRIPIEPNVCVKGVAQANPHMHNF